jgi:hypothetical protein
LTRFEKCGIKEARRDEGYRILARLWRLVGEIKERRKRREKKRARVL